MSRINRHSSYEELKDSLGEPFVFGLAEMLYRKAEIFYQERELKDVVYFDEEIFSRCMIDVLFDLKRLKDFHELEEISFERTLAYSAGWIIRRKPFQRIRGIVYDQKKYHFLNEKFAFVLMMESVNFTESRNKIRKQDIEQVQGLADRIFYHLCYRDIDVENLELMIYGVKFGKYMKVV